MSLDDKTKNRIKKSIQTFIEKKSPQVYQKRVNGQPEKLLEKEVLHWLRLNGFHVNVVESKSTYNPSVGRYISQSVSQGFADIVGNHDHGMAVFIELKAKGRRSALRENQREFLIEKINTGCFAVVVDSLELLENQWERFCLLKKRRQYQMAKDFLFTALPKKKDSLDDSEPLFPED